MKKILTVLVVLAIVVGSVFAASGDSVNLNSTVGVWRPVIKIGDGGSDGTSYAKKTTTSVNSNLDISEEDITWYFAIYQSGSLKGTAGTDAKTDYAKYRGDVTITVSIEAFKGVSTDTNTNGKTANHGTDGMKVESITAATVITENNNKLSFTTASNNGSNATSSLAFVAKYDGRVKDQDLGMAKCTWLKDQTLEPGAYQATITMTYSPN